MAEAWPVVAKVLEYQHGQMPMFFETLWVNVKLKFSVPSAGREMPSIFCSTQGPTLTLVVVPAVTDCHGQPNATCGSRTLSPTRCRAADSTASTAQTMILRKIRATRTRTAPQASFRGSHRRRARPDQLSADHLPRRRPPRCYLARHGLARYGLARRRLVRSCPA